MELPLEKKMPLVYCAWAQPEKARAVKFIIDWFKSGNVCLFEDDRSVRSVGTDKQM